MPTAIAYVPYTGPIVTRAEAKAAGLSRYFTGKPCPRAHIAERFTASGSCRLCGNAQSNAVHKANPYKQAASQKVWRAANRDRVLAQAFEYRKRNRASLVARSRAFASSPKGKANLKAHYAANTAEIKARIKRWRDENPEQARSYGRNYRARAAAAVGKHTGAEIKALFVRQNGKCAYCRKSIRSGYHADHIQPLLRGGTNWISNIQLTCGPCNIRKRAADPIEFARSEGLLI